MKNFKIEGIILQTTDFGDANRIITIYTKEFGKIDLNAYGCRRSKNSLSGILQIFNHIEAEIHQTSQIFSIRDAEIIYHCKNLTSEIERLAYAAIFFEIVNKFTLPKFPDEKIFKLLKKSLPIFDERNPKISALISSLQFMQFSGFQLNFFECVHCGEKIKNDAAISLIDGGAICMNCVEKSSSDAENYSEELRKTFEKIFSFDFKTETKLLFKKKNIDKAEKILMSQIHAIIGKELNSEKFLKMIKKV